jgi:NAD(P)-dependent dehydrogenase (short-subunit alcohol dehydrogenase family)
MPLDHVGAISFLHTLPTLLGCQQIHAPTQVVLQQPLRWLEWIERFQATVTWAPNFAFALINDRAEEVSRRGWKLGSMRFMVSAGEMVVPRTMRRFVELLGPSGLKPGAIRPAFGMSETSSGITWSTGMTDEALAQETPFLDLGPPIPGASARIVDAQGRVVEEGEIGQLQLKGPSVMPGYHENPEANRVAFTADGWLDTGDRAYLREGRLTVTGREKDVIIINGANHHAHELESLVESVPGVEVSFTAACAVREEGSDTDALALFFSTAMEGERLAALLRELRGRVARATGQNPRYLVPLPKEAIPKTGIGKIQRAELRKRLEQGAYEDVLARVDLLLGNAHTLPDWFFRKAWRPKEPGVDVPRAPTGSVLVLLDREGLGEWLLPRLPGAVGVEAGADFLRLGPARFRLNPREPEHCARLLEALKLEGRAVEQVLHLWAYGPPGEVRALEDFQRALEPGVHGVLQVAQALARVQGPAHPVGLLVATSHAQPVEAEEAVASERSALSGLLATLAQEAPWLRCRHVDLQVEEPAANGVRLLRELAAPPGDLEAVWRGGVRRVACLEKAGLGRSPPQPLPFVQGGFYLISGGLGGIGTEVARLLLTRYEARVLLVGRTPLPEPGQWEAARQRGDATARRLEAWLSLRGLPGALRYESVDVGDPQRLRELVSEASAAWGRPLDGVFHLAGVTRERLLLEETREGLEEVLRAKVWGARVLARLLEGRPEAPFVCFSSVNGYFGGATVGAYSAASAALESAVHAARREGLRHGCCLSWSLWDELGMSRAYAFKDLARARGYQAIGVEQGMASLLAALHAGLPHLLIGLDGRAPHVRAHVEAPLRPLQALAAWHTGQPAPEALARLEVVDRFRTRCACELTPVAQLPRTADGALDLQALQAQGQGQRQRVAYEEPRSEAEQAIASLWRELLRVTKVGVHDNFFDLGGNSIMTVQLQSRLQAHFQRPITPVDIFAHPTIDALARFLSRSAGADEAPAPDRERAEGRREALRRQREARQRTRPGDGSGGGA